MTWKLSSRNSRSPLVVETGPKVGWYGRMKAAIHGNVLLVAEAAGAAASAVGVPLAAVTGKLYLAGLVALFGLSCVLRFVRLRKKRRHPVAVHAALPPSSHVWLTPVVGLLSAVEVALLVEATRLPIRADQPGFDTANWWWVLAGFVVLFWMQRSWLGDRLKAKTGSSR